MEQPNRADCRFCRIIAGDLDAHVVYEDADVVAFLDVRPLFHGHTLVVPRAHIETLGDVPAELLLPLMLVVQRLSVAMPVALGSQGSFVACNNRVSQSVPHLHWHVVPRTKGDGMRGFFWPRTKYESDEQAREVASVLRRVLG
ncbi:MAG: HIT family protein [Coriobacteriales bacterium]|nr:HIT family protein [Coriobacteriales bacterium]